MVVEITHVRFEGNGRGPDAIIAYQWVSRDSGKVGWSDKPNMVSFVRGGGTAYVGQGANQVITRVVDPERGNAYIRTVADGYYTNNLESLPTF
ncbi:hypothetical protein JOF42_000363 [Microbacterium phyllosphaerae]|uniref:DUF3892 domain-containing protein n=1 Tax=Microbacterium phyllosphaerae TaxID=124798 RepID=A0ABS4WLP9_9MICO|nr:DUF3892 domain-containing protein [Microbacterium phyllosphaerae]MBP2376868.1 hypothetical protein [Microbacterium phyllosphaerae]